MTNYEILYVTMKLSCKFYIFVTDKQLNTHKICSHARILRFVEDSDIKSDNKVNPFKMVVQMKWYLKGSMVQENTNFIAGTNINFRLICFRIWFLNISITVCHIKFWVSNLTGFLIIIILPVESHWDLSLLFVILLFLVCIQGAFGYFEVTKDITRFTKATVFKSVRKRTKIAVRFSTTGGELGSADTVRWESMSKDFRTLCGGFSPFFALKDKLVFIFE